LVIYCSLQIVVYYGGNLVAVLYRDGCCVEEGLAGRDTSKHGVVSLLDLGFMARWKAEQLDGKVNTRAGGCQTGSGANTHTQLQSRCLLTWWTEKPRRKQQKIMTGEKEKKAKKLAA